MSASVTPAAKINHTVTAFGFFPPPDPTAIRFKNLVEKSFRKRLESWHNVLLKSTLYHSFPFVSRCRSFLPVTETVTCHHSIGTHNAGKYAPPRYSRQLS